MDKFIEELVRVIGIWPPAAMWKIHQVAMYTRTDMEELCELYGSFKGEEVNKHSRLSKDDGIAFLEYCQEKEKKGIAAVRLEDQEKQEDALNRAEGFLSKIKELKESGSKNEAINSYYYMIGEIGANYPKVSDVVGWYSDVNDMIFELNGKPQEVAQNVLKSVNLLYQDKKLDDIKDLFDQYKDKLPEETVKYLLDEIEKTLKTKEFTSHFPKV